MAKNIFKISATNAIAEAAPASVWGKGVPGKGGAVPKYVAAPENKKEKENE